MALSAIKHYIALSFRVMITMCSNCVCVGTSHTLLVRIFNLEKNLKSLQPENEVFGLGTLNSSPPKCGRWVRRAIQLRM